MQDTRIVDWLSAIPQHRKNLEPPTLQLGRPTKRARLSYEAWDNRRSFSPHVSGNEVRMPILQSPSKQPRDSQGEGLSQRDVAPQPQRSSAVPGDAEGSPCPKQAFHDQLKQVGFRVFDFETDKTPASLLALQQQLEQAWIGEKILPKSLKHVLEDFIPCFFFDDDDKQSSLRYPSLERVRCFLAQAEECHSNCETMSSWNVEVHAPILSYVLREDPTSDNALDFRYCPTADLIQNYRTKDDVSSNMVDFCLAIKPAKEEQKLIESVRKLRPGDSINHTNWGRLNRQPIAVCIRTQPPGEKPATSLLQIAKWHSAQWKSWRWWSIFIPTVGFLPGIIIKAHEWKFVATTSEGILHPPLKIGDTRTVQGIYKLLISLQHLKHWAEESFWPAFQQDVLENDF